MNNKLQLGGLMLAVMLAIGLAFPADAQWRPHARRIADQQQKQKPRPERRAERRGNPNPNRPPVSSESVAPNMNRPPERARNQNRPPSANTAPRNFNSLNPQEKQRALNNYRNYQKLPPGQRQQMQEAARNWNRLSPEQRSHIKNDVLPRWQQLPPQRQRAIQQRLGVLKSMPESARNQHLNDPNFTRGMNDEDKSMLQDLSHLHVGGAPDAPPNE